MIIPTKQQQPYHQSILRLVGAFLAGVLACSYYQQAVGCRRLIPTYKNASSNRTTTFIPIVKDSNAPKPTINHTSHPTSSNSHTDTNTDSTTRQSSAEAEETAPNRDAAALAFSQLELFVSTFPGNYATPNVDNKADTSISGLLELQETFLRTYAFFWPHNHMRLTTILDEPSTTTGQEQDERRQALRAQFQTLLTNLNLINTTRSTNNNSIHLQFNPRTNTTLYGTGWYIQQLVMMWADNFTNAQYIGFVDDDTLLTSAVAPHDLFDDEGRPRVLAQPAAQGRRAWTESSEYALGKTAGRLHAMTYFPVIVKREHLALMRAQILKQQQQGKNAYNTFDEFFTALIHRGNNPQQPLTEVSQFCIMMDYLYQFHCDEYSWHFETTKSQTQPIPESTPKMYEPIPRIAIHGSYLFVNVQRLRSARTLPGRRREVSEIMREGYCYSLRPTNDNDNNTTTSTTSTINDQRCQKYKVDTGIHVRGEWKFEQYPSPWLKDNAAKVTLAHEQRRRKHADHHHHHVWDEAVVKSLFGR